MRVGKKPLVKALATARGLLKKDPRPAARVAGVLNPYMGCTEIMGVTGRLHEDLRCSIFAVMGDAYRCEGNIEMAAKWYRRASQLSPGSHARIYAQLVCKHQLTEFYEDALIILVDHQRRWREKGIITRFFLRLLAWTKRESRELARSEKPNLAFLRQHALPKAA